MRDDESPNYQVRTARKWPDMSLGITFIPGVADELMRHAFDLHLDCLWSLAGCRKVNQIAPDAIHNEQTIERTALERMNGPEPCPNRILPRRARDSKDILLVETTRLSSLHQDPHADGQYRIASFRLVKAIKGSVGRPLANVRVDQGIWRGSAQIHNSAIDLLRPGQRLLLFSGYSDSIDEFCEALAATPSAIQTIIDNLPQFGPAIAKEHPKIELPPPQ